MPIRPSAGGEIRRLIDALSDADDIHREAAIARLGVIGRRAVERLLQQYDLAAPRARAGMLRVLELAVDPRALPLALSALDDADQDVATAAVGALRGLLEDPQVSRDALDTLVTRALDGRESATVRLAALDALRDAPADVRAPVFATLSSDPNPSICARTRSSETPSPNALWREMIEGRLGKSPSAAKAAIAAHRVSGRLTDLQHLVDHLREREQQESEPAVQEEWRAARGAVHQALAARGSRIALYDLRESLLGAERLPVAFLAAIEEIGDASCLEPLAATYEASSRSGDIWWRQHVAAAFRAIVEREGLTRRHAIVKRLMSRHGETAGELMGRA